MSQRKVSYVLSVSVLATFITGGCFHNGGKPGEMKDVTGIDVGIRNLGTKRIEDSSIAFGNYSFTLGIISPGKKAVHVCSGQSIPDMAEIVFELESGKTFKKMVSVAKHLPLNASDDLVLHFNIDDKQNIQVEFLHFIMEDGRSKLVSYD
jgi:hypothetical protein